jgi:hypothetical protein
LEEWVAVPAILYPIRGTDQNLPYCRSDFSFALWEWEILCYIQETLPIRHLDLVVWSLKMRTREGEEREEGRRIGSGNRTLITWVGGRDRKMYPLRKEEDRPEMYEEIW